MGHSTPNPVLKAAQVPRSALAWLPCHRLIASRFPTVGLFDDIADPADLEVVFAIEMLTNPRLRQDLGQISLVPPDQRVTGPGATLLMNPGTGGLLPSSQAPLDKELVDQFLSINVDAMEAAMAKERRRLAKEHGLSPDLLVDDDAQRGIDSIRIIQDLLRRNPTQTMEEFVKAYAARLPELVS